jgi:hypothetical protein
MSMASRLYIDKMIIHKVDHRSYDAPQLADLDSPVDDVEVLSFLRQHIVRNMMHKHARTAAFLPNEEDVCLRDMCDRLLEDREQFVPQSQAIARHLFSTMDNRVSPGDLVLCTFADRGEDAPTWLALLKMDPEDGFVGMRESVDGKVRVVLRRVHNVLPRGELQKCAFILPPDLRASRGFDLRVLDQQIDHQGAARLVASFFSTRFLQCDVQYAPQDSTRAYYFRTQEWLQTRDHWPKMDVQRAQRQVKSSLKRERVDATAVAQQIAPGPEEQDQYLGYLQARGVKELVFEPDPGETQRLLRYTEFEGDFGLRVRIESGAVGEGRTLWWTHDPANGDVLVTIRTSQWDEKA